MSDFRILQGSCRPLFVFEVGHSIDLEAAARRLGPGPDRTPRPQGELAASPFEYRPLPLVVAQPTGTLPESSFRFGPTVELSLHDFGAATVAYELPLGPGPNELLEQSVALRRHQPLAADARRRVSALIESLGPAVQRPRVAEPLEDYFIFELIEVEGVRDAAAFCAEHAGLLARVLRAERSELAPDEVGEALRAAISYGRGDRTLVDWNSAVILHPEPADLRAVLEFANVQLLELRFLDDQLDRALDRAYRLLSRRAGVRGLAPGFLEDDRRELSTLQVDSAMLLERVSNALKFLGEEYLARLYRLAASRLHLAEWDGVITRKLATLESIYQKISDRASARRLELLEWVVIILIALEIVLTLSK